MNSMFRRTLAAFFLTVLVIITVLAVGLFTGYNRSLALWSTERRGGVERIARMILENHRDENHRDENDGTFGQAGLPPDVPVFVYDADRELVASNRGVGRRRELDGIPTLSVRDDEGTILGYYSAGAARFHADTANRALMEALIRAAVTAVVAAAGIAAISAVFLARYLSRPAADVASGIDRMAKGHLVTRIPETGALEISRIAHSANLLVTRLEQEQLIRAQWVQDVAHDLRSPVAMIKAQLEAIADGVYTADVARLGRLLTELGRVEQLIQDLDELMRLEAPELRPEIARFSAISFLENLRERFADTPAARGVHLESRSELSMITGDENLLYRAVSNLLSNAIHHGADRGTVRCLVTSGTAETPGNTVKITVWNDGPPVPPEDLSRVFDRLYRGEYARNTPGTGLGLTITRRIVQLHGGTIRMDSAAGAGTTVAIELPQDRNDYDSRRLPLSPSPSPPPQS